MSDEGSRTVRMPDEESDVGPHFPSGMNTVEAALAGATNNMSDEDVELLKAREEGTEAELLASRQGSSEDSE